MVGRIIGKQRKKVLELQRESHAIIEVPMANTLEDMGCSSCNKSSSLANCAMLLNGMIHHADCKQNSDVMLVKLLGHFWALQSAQEKMRSIAQKGKASPGLSGFLPGVGDPHVNAFPNMGTPVTPKSPATIAASGSFINAAVKMAGGMSFGASAAPGAPTMSAASAQQLIATSNNCVAANSNGSVSNHANTIASPVINVSAAFGQF